MNIIGGVMMGLTIIAAVTGVRTFFILHRSRSSLLQFQLFWSYLNSLGPRYTEVANKLQTVDYPSFARYHNIFRYSLFVIGFTFGMNIQIVLNQDTLVGMEFLLAIINATTLLIAGMIPKWNYKLTTAQDLYGEVVTIAYLETAISKSMAESNNNDNSENLKP